MKLHSNTADGLSIGLALSGGGSRAIAFHLGCMRALHDRDLLKKIRVLSTTSGGSVVGALYAYSNCSFEEFEDRIENLLSNGLSPGIVRFTLFSLETPKIAASLVTSGVLAFFGRVVGFIVTVLGFLGIKWWWLKKISKSIQAPVPRFASRTTAFIRLLDTRYFHGCLVSEVARNGLNVVINATELKTETAFRYGSVEAGSWRFGKLVSPTPVAKAVAASAAFPGLLPAIDEKQKFSKAGKTTSHRIMVTDGGVYDNLGTSCLIPNPNPNFSINVNDVDFIIACVAGQGLPDASSLPYFWPSRMLATVNTIHRRTHSMTFNLLHRLTEKGDIKGFLLPYLGQQDEKLPSPPPDLVSRNETYYYPTDFSPMLKEDIRKLSTRGEQLTRNLIETYYPDI